MKTRSQKGFTMVETLVALIVIAGLAFAGYAVWHNKNNKTNNSSTANTSPAAATATTQPVSTAPALTKTYTDTDGQFTLKYPADWKVNTDKYGAKSLTSPNGETIDVAVMTQGGTDYNCGIDKSCPTLKYLSWEEIGVKALSIRDNVKTANDNDFVYEHIPLSLVTKSETDKKGKTIYYIGLSDATGLQSQMGKSQANAGSATFGFWFTKDNNNKKSYPLINLQANSTSKNFLTSEDGKTIKAILKSFEYTQ